MSSTCMLGEVMYSLYMDIYCLFCSVDESYCVFTQGLQCYEFEKKCKIV